MNKTTQKLLKRGRVSYVAQQALALLFCCMCLPAFAQVQKKLDASFKNEPLKKIFALIEAQGGYTVNYAREDVNADTKVNLQVKQATVQQLLDAALKGTNYSYTADGNIIIIKPKPVNTKNGTVSGKVIDEANGEVIPGATVRIGHTGTTSGPDGTYSLSIPAGEQTASISYIGYQSKEISGIHVAEGKDFSLNLTLVKSKGQLSTVVIKGSANRESVAALYIAQKNSPVISDGISAEQIARTPDKNVGEILKRVSGVGTMDNKYVVVRGLSERYNNALFNGQVMPSTELNRKQFSFDIIPSTLVDNVIVYKTVTPDMSAEFGGGLLAVNTKALPGENFFKVGAGIGYNDETTGKNFRSLQPETREYFGFAPKHRELFGNRNWKSTDDIIAAFKQRGEDKLAFNNNWGLYSRKAPVSSNYEMSFGRTGQLNAKTKIGITGATGLRNTYSNSFARMTRNNFIPLQQNAYTNKAGYRGRRYSYTSNLSGLLGVGISGNRYKLSLQSIYMQLLDNQLIIGSGEHTDPSGYMVGYYDLTQQSRMWQNQLKGELMVGNKGAKLSWMGSYLLLDRQRPDNHQFIGNLQQESATDAEEFNVAGAMSILSAGALRWWTRAHEKSLGYNVDFAQPLGLSKGNHTLKAGYAGWTKNRYFYVLNTGHINSTEYYPPLSTLFGPQNLDSIYLSRFSDDFNRKASLHAGYAMLDNKLGNWRLVWGLRAEYFDMNKANARLDAMFAEINSTRGGNNQFDYSALRNREKNWNFFPSANLTYSLNTTMNLRASYAQSIVRPDLRELSYFREYDFELGGSYESFLVRSTHIKHYDFRYEWYPGTGEVMSVSLFYKKLDYPMEIYQGSHVNMYELVNNLEAENKGIEVEMRKSLAFTRLPVLKNVTAYGNFTILDGSVTPMVFNPNNLDPQNENIIKPEEVILPKENRLQSGASNYMVNAGLYYDQRPVSLSVSYNYVSNRMLRPTRAYAASIYERPMESLDAQIAVKMLKGRGEFKVNLSNLLNSSSIAYQNQYEGKEYPDNDEHKVPSTKQLQYDNADMINFEARPGRSATASFSYRF